MRSLLSSLPFSRIGSNPREIGEGEEWWAEEEVEESSGERFEVDLVFFFSAFINEYCLLMLFL